MDATVEKHVPFIKAAFLDSVCFTITSFDYFFLL